MGDVTKNISRHELRCHCGNCEVEIDIREPIIQAVQSCCDYFADTCDVPRVILDITSAARCHEYNRLPVKRGGAGSSDDSRHPKGDAMDIKIFTPDGQQINPEEVAEWFSKYWKGKHGIGRYKTFTHVDTRPWCARWIG